jgi:hypothetical protein
MELNTIQKDFIDKKLITLSKSKFRNSFHLRKYMYEYIDKHSIETIEKHCEDFINSRLAVYQSDKDGKQTPTKGHPVFIAQHATACCCRGCLEKWHKISLILYIVMGWCIVITFKPLWNNMNHFGILLLLLGGVVYTVGAILYGIGKKKEYMHSLFHLFCVAASFCFFCAVYFYAL